MEPIKDKPTANPDGTLIEPRIEGLVIRPAVHMVDNRGELVEVYNPAWGFHPDPLVYIYQVMVLPGAGRGWVIHEKQDDRIYHCHGYVHWAFYDNRPDSPTYQMLNTVTLSERNRSLMTIPQGVYHACVNVGSEEALFFNMPTQPYNHGNPDKYRLPLKNDLIPYDFSESRVR
jgi:dTDP-4-dehydrorhamnose 3,5-epimerase